MDDREARLLAEYDVIRAVFPTVERLGNWFRLPHDKRAVAHGWGPDPFPVAFHAQADHPGNAPYGIYVSPRTFVRGTSPNNFQGQAGNRPPFAGEWGVLSWAVEGPWLPKVDVRKGANLLTFLLSFDERYRMGP